MPQAVSRDEFIFEFIPKYPTWAAKALTANIKTPSDDRIALGWAIEKPLHTYFNWHMNRTDVRLVELEARVAWLEKRLEELGMLEPTP